MSEISCYDHGFYFTDPNHKRCPWCELEKRNKVIEMVVRHYEGLDETNCPGFVGEARKLVNA